MQNDGSYIHCLLQKLFLKTSEERNMDNNLMQRRKIANIHFVEHIRTHVKHDVGRIYSLCMRCTLLNKLLLVLNTKEQILDLVSKVQFVKIKSI